ncbi:hypothetical protein C8R46DRAFT_981335 [Mycena filopes]|nr:hypothetical protein C8R46DRAFT_981335 [Mycena filopes]
MGFGRRRRGVEVSGPSDSTADDEEVGDEDGEAEPEVGEPAAVGENVEGERTMPPPAEEGAAQAGAEGAAPAAAQAQGPPQGQAPALPLPDTSRTFLIYVIGGYYPPEHGILNGAEGFEALLDLTELLGPLRPPTASKADIARAGLAIVRRADLAGLESEGKVVNNCVDRCLICLDDYDEADEIRVLSCRHAFHQTCVDRWLETGRNNCPACRSKGVSTDPTTPPPPPPVATEAH